MRTTRIALGLALAAGVLGACKKEEGEGGKAAIRGKVFMVEYNENTGQAVDSFYAPDQRVYIIYGDNEVADDDRDTNPEGLYRFDWLRKGDYTLYTYSDCPTCPGETEAVHTNVEIADKKEVVDAPTLRVEWWH